MELRKEDERVFHNLIRSGAVKSGASELKPLTLNEKYYQVTRSSWKFIKQIIIRECKGRKVLDYCCGNGCNSFFIAKCDVKEVCGIDISEVSIDLCRKMASERGLNNKTIFKIMDAEKMEFPDNNFDIAFAGGVLHHLEIERAYSELARVLKPDGKVICVEALGHNPIIQFYRKMTPHLRTGWETEHILRKKDIELAKNYFGQVDILGYFHLAVLAAVPFRNTPLFNPLLKILEGLDNILLRIPILQLQAWQVIFLLSTPKKPSKSTTFNPKRC